MRVHKPADKKIKTVKEEPTTTKRGAKNVRANEYLFKTSIKQYGGQAGRQANLGGRLLSEHSKRLTSFLTFLLPLIHGKGVYFIPKGKE